MFMNIHVLSIPLIHHLQFRKYWRVRILWVAGAGIGLGFPGLQFGAGIGAGCGLGVGFGYGLGKGRAYDENGQYSNIGKLTPRKKRSSG